MKLWKFEIEGEGTCYTRQRPPGWTDNMQAATPVLGADIPEAVHDAWTEEAMTSFEKEYGAPLHSVVLLADGSIKQNAWATPTPMTHEEATAHLEPETEEIEVEEEADPED